MTHTQIYINFHKGAHKQDQFQFNMTTSQLIAFIVINTYSYTYSHVVKILTIILVII